jgi:hypothetical protein
MKFMDSEAGREVRERLLTPHYAPLLARALERGDRSTLRELQARKSALAIAQAHTLGLGICETQLLSVLGETKRARAALAASSRALAAMPEPGLLDIALRATHLRNRVRLGEDGRAELEQLLAQGCRLLKPLLDQSPL